ncbi:MAG: tetratricopeptide repeat protein, partial [Planctomycetota bacterium]
LAYLLALMAKPTSTPLPLLLLLLDYWPLRRLSRKAVLEKTPLIAIGVAFMAITIISQSRAAFVLMPGEETPGRIPLILFHNVIFYLWKVVWPVSLSSHYPFPRPMGLSNPMVLAGVIGTVVLLPGLLVSLRWTRALLVGWLFFLVAIFPTMGVIGFTNMIASARYLYLPTIGLMLPLACLLAWFWKVQAAHPRVTMRRVEVLLIGVALSAALSLETRRGLDSWRTTESRFRYLLAVAPQSSILHNNFGVHLFDQGRLDEAIEHYHRALSLAPNYAAAHNNLGNALRRREEHESAVIHFRQAVRHRRGFAKAHMNLAFTLQHLGRLDEAVQHFRQAAEIEPDAPTRHLDLGQALRKLGEIEEAVKHYNRALELKPDYAEAHTNLGNIHQVQGDYDQAIERYAEALRHDPELLEAHYNKGLALKKQGKLDEAIAAFRELVRIYPDHAQARYNLGNLLSRQDKFDDAIAEYETALQLNPDQAQARQELEAARARRDR